MERHLNRKKKQMKTDVESGDVGDRPLYPSMVENPNLRWSFIRKVYCILLSQLLLTIAVAFIVIFVRPIPHFFFSTINPGLILFFLLFFLPIIMLLPLYYYHKKHPLNYFLLFLFTVTLAFPTGLICGFFSAKIVLESLILTTVMVVSLTLYTFWAARRGHDFNFLMPFLLGALLILIVFGLIQIVYPLGKWSRTIYGGLGSIIFCGFIIYDTDNLIKRFSYDDFIWASVSLYLDTINLFLSLLNILR
ncbi:hypothetical protein VNO78_17366 [Psophocarpus tetragonolobus]|uniref:BI1-like protein n=1 Tax=Psophocarpus tetragonolobus TaxID=3891 RepID=A0AAN9SH98_PSOTE